MKNYPESVRCYEIALKTRPGWLEAIRDFSELLIKCQDTKQAQELVEQSIKLHPDDVDLLCILGRIYLNQFDYDNATKTFKRAEKLKQNDINILVGLSKSLEKGMKIEPAMEKILDAVDIAPENLEVCKQYAHVLLSAQRYDKALDLIKTIDEKSDGKDLQILDLYGQYFVCRGDEEAAETYFNKIRKINHHYKDYMINAADRYIQTGNYEKAEEMAGKFVESRPNLPEGYNLLGTINSARGELSKAKSEYEKGISLKNPNIYAVKQLEKIYSEMEANKEIYNDGETPIAVDADQLSQEEGGNLAENDSLNNEADTLSDQVDALMEGAEKGEELPDIGSLEATPPIEQALTGEDGDFWEDFDDDPDAEHKPLDEEEDAYDENEENSDLMSMMTPAAGESALKDGLSEDAGDFDFGDFEDASGGESAAAPATEAAGRAEPAEPTEAEMQPENIPAADELPAEAAPETDAEQMMKDLQQQQKELELQQRELALQQKEFADELKQENEKMIQEAVENAVEEKLSEYDLTPEEEPVEEAAEEVAEEAEEADESTEAAEAAEGAEENPAQSLPDEIPSDDFDLQLYDEDFGDVDFVDELEDENALSSSESEEVLAEEAALDGLDSDEEEEPVAKSEPETEASEEEVVEEEIAAESAEEEIPLEETPEEESEEDADEEHAAEDSSDDLNLVPFVTVEEMAELLGEEAGPAAEPVPEVSAKTVPVSETSEDMDDSFVTADDMLDKIGRILNDNDLKKSCSAELDLFKTLRNLSSYLPEKDKNSYDCCRIRMVIEYIIQKLSGKPGLLITAESLIKSGVLGEEYNRQLEDCCEEELSNDLIRHVISDMKKLAQNLEDKELSNALCVSADKILEQIALLDQQVSIF